MILLAWGLQIKRSGDIGKIGTNLFTQGLGAPILQNITLKISKIQTWSFTRFWYYVILIVSLINGGMEKLYMNHILGMMFLMYYAINNTKDINKFMLLFLLHINKEINLFGRLEGQLTSNLMLNKIKLLTLLTCVSNF